MRFPSRLSGDDGRAEGQGTSPRHVVAHGATKRLGLSSSRGPREATKGPRSPSRAPSPSSPSICMYMSLLAMLLAALSVSVPRAAASPFRSEMQLAGHQVQRVTVSRLLIARRSLSRCQRLYANKVYCLLDDSAVMRGHRHAAVLRYFLFGLISARRWKREAIEVKVSRIGEAIVCLFWRVTGLLV